jgi:octaprenyl-diphosphate synthase
MRPLIAAGITHLQEELTEVEQMLRMLLNSEIPTVADLGRYLLESGGKRFRPALTLLFYRLLGSKGPRSAAIELAAVVEMIHLSTLAHDDVIDQAPMRRNRPSLWRRSNNRSAVLEGDFIFSRAFRLLNPHPIEIRSLIIEAVEQLLEGELLQESLRWQLPTPEEYDRVIERKTAALISAACTIGALLGDPELERQKLESIRQAGRLLGTAYQLVDDLLDVFGDEKLDKPTWTDQRGGWLTWPYIRLVEEEPRLGELLQKGPLDEVEKLKVLEEMARYGIREQGSERAKQAVAGAKARLSWIADCDLKGSLFAGFDAVVTRKS